MSEGFFNRWSRRKLEGGPAPMQDTPAPAEPIAPPALRRTQSEPPLGARQEGDPHRPVSGAPQGQPEPAQALPTLEDVQRLRPSDDFMPFMREGVAPQVRNAAMKKLFADPHFNVMDGLDIYIDDYNRPDPLPAGMLRRMASAQFLGLVPNEAPVRQDEHAAAPLGNPTPVDGMQVVAQSPDSSASADTASHDHTDLQLQPDPAPADPQPGPGPR